MGLHRWSFRLSGLHEALRVVTATLAGTAVFVAVFYFLQTPGPPRSVLVMEFFLTASLVGTFRFSPRFAQTWLLAQSRSRSGSRKRTLIVGAGSAGDLLQRDLLRSEEHAYDVVGFVDDDRRKWGQWIGGRPVLGPIAATARIWRAAATSSSCCSRSRACPRRRLREILAACAELKLSYKILPVSFAYLNDRADASMLADLSPDHLLPRHEVRFDDERDATRSCAAGASWSPEPRLDRQRGLPADRRPRAGTAGARRHRREQPLLPVPAPAPQLPASSRSRRR